VGGGTSTASCVPHGRSSRRQRCDRRRSRAMAVESQGKMGRLQRKAALAKLGAKPWKPQIDPDVLPVFRIRDLPMSPEEGMQKDMHWMHFQGSVQLRLALEGDRWREVREEDFEVRVSETELTVKCKAAVKDATEALDALNGKLKREVNPKRCWYGLERDVGDPSRKVLVVELAKKYPGKAWASEKMFQESIFNRKSFAWSANQQLLNPEEAGWITLAPGRRSDIEDPFTVSRGWLCTELEQGQTDELVQFRIILDQKKLDEALEKVPYYSMFGADCSEKYFKLFIRGDESSPVLLGEFAGRVCPKQTILEMTTVTREVAGHRIAGTMETLPCLDVTIFKRQEHYGEWGELLQAEEDALNQPQGSLEEYEHERLKQQREPSPDREDWTPDDWADEQKDMADAAFKEGCFRDAIVYYTRALRHTPRNEKLLSNRSACYMKICKYQPALDDIEEAQRIQPSWPKIYFRKGQALRGLRRFDDAVAAFRAGRAIDSKNPEWDKEIKRTKDAEAALAERRKAKAAES